MIRVLHPNIIQIRGGIVSSYLLLDPRGACVIDGGFVGDVNQLENALKNHDLGWRNVHTILVTHGHVDHIYQTARIAELSGATIYAHPLEKSHLLGKHPYLGISRVCGYLECVGRKLLGFQAIDSFRGISDGDWLDCCGGIKTVHLPGHTAGHCGFWHRDSGILFSGDLILNAWWRMMVPWPWLNTCPEQLKASLDKICELSPAGMLSNHCDLASPWHQRDRFLKAHRGGRIFNLPA